MIQPADFHSMYRIALVLVALTGCATTGPGSRPPVDATLAVSNRSGGVVRIFLDNGSTIRPLRRSYPGSECIDIPRGGSSSIRLGFQHLAQRTEWSDRLQIQDGHGWYIELNQPLMIVWDVVGISPSVAC